VNTKQQTILEDINHNVVAIGRFLIESLTPKRKKEVITPRVKRKKTLAEMIVQVLGESNEQINCSNLGEIVRKLSYRYDQNTLTPTLRRLVQKRVIRVQKSKRNHLYSIAHKPGRKAA